MIDVSPVIDFFATPVQVRRVNEDTTYIDGLAQVTTSVFEFELQGVSVQPMLATERQLLPEGIRDRGMLKAFTRCPLLGVDVEGNRRADRIDYRGEQYVVHSVEDWRAQGGFYKVVLLREDDDA